MKKKAYWCLLLAALLLAAPAAAALRGTAAPAAPGVAGAYSTVVFAKLWNGTADVTAHAGYEVTASLGGECRAAGQAMELPDGGTVLMFRIWGTTGVGGTADETGLPITFRLHEGASGSVCDLSVDETLSFRGDYTYGQPSDPVALRFDAAPVVPIEALRTAADHLIVYQGESDIRERLDALVAVLPAESTQGYHWEVEQETPAGTLVIDATTGDVYAKHVGTATIVAVADADPAVRSPGVKVTAVNPARTLSAARGSLSVYLSGQGGRDVSDDVNALIHVGPAGYSTINVSYTSSDPTVVSTSRDEKSGQQRFVALKLGSAVVTTKLTFLDCYTEKDSTLTLDLNIYVSVPLTGVAANRQTLTVNRDGTALLTLTAQPEGAVLSQDSISLTLADGRIARIGDFEVEDGASSVEVPIEGLFPGTTSLQGAIKPDGKVQTLAAVDVEVATQLEEGWQWVSLYLPVTVSGKALEDAFGDALAEVRSQNLFLFNDPDCGYVGPLLQHGLVKGECYKVNMAAAASHVFGLGEGGVAPFGGGSVYISQRWTWLGNPYYCSHPLEGYVSGAREGDMIVSQEAYAVFTDGHWRGSLEALRYGEAYMYYADQETATLRLKGEGYVSDLTAGEAEDEEPRDEDAKAAFAAVPPRRFMDNMSLTAALGAGFSAADRYQLAAFVDGECRGTARLRDGLFFLTVHGKAGETVCLRLFDEQTGVCHDVQGTLPLQLRQGTPTSPLLVNRAGHDTLVLGVGAPAAEDGYYSLQGIRLRRAPRKGVYIYKGHKVIVR